MRKDLIDVFVNGIPGKMATQVAAYIMNNVGARKIFYLCPYSLTGAEVAQKGKAVAGRRIYLFQPDIRGEWANIVDRINDRKKVIVVDYTHPLAVEENVKLYCDLGVSFVLGTTGGDYERLKEIVSKSDACAVIAPNMTKQIVAFQAMMEFMAQNSPNVFSGYLLEIEESHQEGKADTSGTAKAMVKYFNALGIPFSADQIKKIRDPKMQRAMGVPKKYLTGHGWHTYTVRSPEGDIFFQFVHNINGREVYARGTADAIAFLYDNYQAGRVYTMQDVLRG